MSHRRARRVLLLSGWFGALLLAVACEPGTPPALCPPATVRLHSGPHCMVTVTACTALRPAVYRPGCWELEFTVVVQGSSLDLIGRVVSQLDGDGLARPSLMATLQRDDGTFIALPPTWPTEHGPTQADIPSAIITPMDPRESAIQLPSGDWRIPWSFALACAERPVGRIRLDLNGAATLARVSGGREARWQSAPFTFVTPPQDSPRSQSAPDSEGAGVGIGLSPPSR